MKRKSIFLDVDGTLVSGHATMNPKVVEAINRARQNGHYVFICTPRQPGQICLTNKIFRECFGQFVPDGERTDFLRFFHIPSIYPVTSAAQAAF